MHTPLMESAPGPETVIDGVPYLYFAGTTSAGALRFAVCSEHPPGMIARLLTVPGAEAGLTAAAPRN